MFIKKLKLYNFRSIIEKEFLFKENINIFHGCNGAGKTSILEAINFISTGKSFRKGNFKSLINSNTKELTVNIVCEHKSIAYSFAVNKHFNGKWQAKKNSEKIQRQYEITNLLPVVSIDPEIYRLVDFGPIYRRNFLDWLVFHVKHDYLILWKKVHKCVKQLNLLYKKKADSVEIDLWEKSFLIFSEELNSIRLNMFNKIHPEIISLSNHMQEELMELTISFKQGWSKDFNLAKQLKIDRTKNLKYGQLQHGPQKMDIAINIGTLPAAQILSRGQKKILSITFYMAYIKLLEKQNIKPIICLDDFDAEIDDDKLAKLSVFFNSTKTQIFITSVQPEKISNVFPNAGMFHVKQ